MKTLPNGQGGMETGVLVQEPIQPQVEIYTHNQLGAGRVIIETQDTITLRFEGIGEKKLIKRYANLKTASHRL